MVTVGTHYTLKMAFFFIHLWIYFCIISSQSALNNSNCSLKKKVIMVDCKSSNCEA